MMTGELPDRTTTVIVDFKGSEPPKDSKGGEQKELETVYYNQKMSTILEHFSSSITAGLSASEAARRLEKWGRNELPSPPPKSWISIIIGQLMDFMLLILLFVAFFSLALQDFVEASVLFLVVFMNVVIGSVQEIKAERALSALESLTAASAKVFRDSAWANVPGAELVPGDIIALEEGDLVPADVRLFEVNGLYVDEAKLTGEAEPIEKIDERIAHEGIGVITVGDRRNMGFMSTLATQGVGTGVVVNTGAHTQIGRISSALTEKTEKDAPMQAKLAVLGKVLVVISVLMCALVIAIGLIRVKVDEGSVDGDDWAAWAKVGVSLAVAVIPEGLIAVVTVSLALATVQLGRANTIVRTMPAVETLGSATVICSDKTGTLTEGKMRSEQLVAGGVTYTIAGTGIIPEGAVKDPNGNELPATSPRGLPTPVYRAMQVCALCNNSAIAYNQEKSEWEYTGDPTEVALEVAARKLSLGFDAFRADYGYTKMFEIPFTSDRKRMTSVFRVNGSGPVDEASGDAVIVAKGALSFLLPSCTSILGPAGELEPLNKAAIEAIEAHNLTLSSKGLRTLALAYRSVSARSINSIDESRPDDTVETDLVFVGLIALRDPPRESVKASIARAKGAGIRVTMITGDSPVTAQAIATQLGIIEEGDAHLVATGAWVDARTHEDLVGLKQFPRVFARVSPANKLALVKALRDRGNVVAMTGDGVNDAPAIRHASVGIAMGQTGTDLTIQAADIVLLDDDFNSVIYAVELGRGVLDNVTKYCLYLLSCNLSEILTMLVSAAVGIVPPFSAVSILYANVLIDVPPSIALGIDTPAADIMERLPRNPKAPIFGWKGAFVIITQAALISSITMFVYCMAIYEHDYAIDQKDLEGQSHARSLAFVTQAAIHLFHSYASRSVTLSIFRKSIFENKILNYGVIVSFIILVVICYIPGLNDVLDQWELNFRDWGYVIGAVIVHLLGTEAIKSVFMRGLFALDPDAAQVDDGKPKFFQAF